MRFNLHLRQSVHTQLTNLAGRMANWETEIDLAPEARAALRQRIRPFPHTTSLSKLAVAGVDGSGDYPALTYADSFVYLSVAQGVIYDIAPIVGLRERPPERDPIVEFTWLASNIEQSTAALLESFENLAGTTVHEVVSRSDYRHLKRQGTELTIEKLIDGLIVPAAHDSGNVSIQLRSTAELGAARRLISQLNSGEILMIDTTLTLPFAAKPGNSLFFEHLKRLCCVEARERGVCLASISKSSGIRSAEKIDELAGDVLGSENKKTAEHWFMRVNDAQMDHFSEGRRITPIGAVTYLFRLHRNVPMMRLDIDEQYWREKIGDSDKDAVIANEQHLFSCIDYASHDQRSFGYPYPLKAGHDRASLTQTERAALRKQIIDAAVSAGMRRRLFRDASRATGHA
jgi:hypothetical protein